MNKTKDTLKEIITSRLNKINATPNEKLGQHFLIDQNSIERLVDCVHADTTVIEVGPGVGQLTEKLAKRARKVIAIEIDLRYKPILSSIQKVYSNLQVIYEDALSINWHRLIKNQEKQKVQIISSLPYQITEPFLHLVSKLKILDITLVIGQRLGRAIEAKDEQDPNFSQRTLLNQTFFNTEILSSITKQNFFPIPKTDSIIIRLTPKTKDDFDNNKRNFIFRRLFLTSSYSPMVKNCIKEALIEQHRPEKLTQNQARETINKLNIDKSTLDKSFDQLNNKELATLSLALGKL